MTTNSYIKLLLSSPILQKMFKRLLKYFNREITSPVFSSQVLVTNQSLPSFVNTTSSVQFSMNLTTKMRRINIFFLLHLCLLQGYSVVGRRNITSPVNNRKSKGKGKSHFIIVDFF